MLRQRFRHALRVFDAVPGYRQLPWYDRQRFNLRALRDWLLSGDALRLALWVAAAILAVQIAIWEFDLGVRAAVRLTLAQALWIGPWIAHARRRALRKLLKNY